jgi:hypothetical protein
MVHCNSCHTLMETRIHLSKESPEAPVNVTEYHSVVEASNNLVIRYKHDKKIYLIERFDACVYRRELSHYCKYTRMLDLT